MRRKKYGLIGHPLGHSLSPYIHKRIMEETGISGDYQLYEIEKEELPEIVPVLLKELDGFNCTIPYKTEIIPYLDDQDKISKKYGAVNTVYMRRGYNTDQKGFLSAVPSMHNKRVLILGAGGVSRMMAFEALEQGAELYICARNDEKRNQLVCELNNELSRFTQNQADMIDTQSGSKVGRNLKNAVHMKSRKIISVQTESELPEVDFEILLNGTPLGMWPNINAIPASAGLFRKGQYLFDTIYNPASTKWMLQGNRAGIRTQSGLKMLLLQAVEAQKIWNPEQAIDINRMLSILPELSEKVLKLFPVKYVFTGFMGAGKTAVTKALSRKLDLPSIDLDDEIVKERGCSIPEIFRRDGEAEFRKIEVQVLENILERPGAALIALGGGALMQEAIRQLLDTKQTVNIYLHASMECIWKRIENSTTRPMLGTDSGDTRFMKAARLFETRLPIYEKYCDAVLDADQEPAAVVEEAVRAMGLT